MNIDCPPSSRTPRLLLATLTACAALSACATSPTPHESQTTPSPKQQVVALIQSLETGDSSALDVIDPNQYIQHNPGAEDGRAGLDALIQSVPPGSARARPVRVFQDGDYVFTHTDFDFFGPKAGFDIFRFRDGKIVEHWDNLQEKPAQPNPSGHTMIDGPTEAIDLEQTEANKQRVASFIDDILVHGRMEKLADYFDGDNYIQHNPQIADGVSGLEKAMQAMAQAGITMKYDRVHKVLGEGNFVLVVSEGNFAGKPTSFYDLFRVDHGKIAEHWDTIETIPPSDQWKNPNGKFGF